MNVEELIRRRANLRHPEALVRLLLIATQGFDCNGGYRRYNVSVARGEVGKSCSLISERRDQYQRWACARSCSGTEPS